MKRFLYGLAALPFLAGVSFAGQPVPLSDAQMDRVTAGFDFTELEKQNTGWLAIGVNAAAPAPPVVIGASGAVYGIPYIVVTNRYFPGGGIAMQTASGFGPVTGP